MGIEDGIRITAIAGAVLFLGVLATLLLARISRRFGNLFRWSPAIEHELGSSAPPSHANPALLF